jgi:putative transposase
VYNEPGHAHYLTFSCNDRLQLLNRDRVRRWVIEAIDEARRKHEMDLYAYVVMPEHLHLLVRSQRREYDMGRFRADLKRPVSRKAKSFLEQAGETVWMNRLSVRSHNRSVFCFWLPGGGFDRNITERDSLRRIAEYIHNNPVRRGLVLRPTDWAWASAGYWAGMADPVLAMDPFPS